MTNREALNKYKKEVADLYRNVIRLQVEMWDYIGQIEAFVGEIDGHSDDTEMWAVNCGRPGEAMKIPTKQLIESIEGMLCRPDDENDSYE